jgi:predicted negative regulator of RcsB-dependent stress response
VVAHTTEEEQIESLKKWWKENGTSVVVGLVVGFGALIGGNYWMQHTETQSQNASLEFSQLQDDMQQSLDASVMTRGDHIINNFSDTPYAVLSAFAIAKLKVDEGDLLSARARLQWVLDNSKQTEFLHMARIRMAAVMLAEGNADGALSLINTVEAGEYLPLYEELKGDIYAAKSQKGQARSAYERALKANDKGDNSLLQMKLDDLGGEGA